MRAFLLPCRGDANALARIVEPPAARQVPSTLEQPADAFTSITALTVWLKAQGDDSSSPELGRLRAAVVVLAQKPKPKQEKVRPLCSAWDVKQKEQAKNRTLMTLIAELRQAVLAEGTRLRARGLAAQLGGSASNETGEETTAAQPVSTASSAEQPACIKVVPSRIAGPVGSVSAKRRQDETTSCETGENTSAAQPGAKSKQRRVTDMLLAANSHPAGAVASSTYESEATQV